MKKVIRLSESQLVDLIKEIFYRRTDIRRRLSPEFTEENVIDRIEAEMEETDPNNYSDEFEYASNILSWVLDYFYEYSDEPLYDELYEEIHTYMKEEYGEMIFEFYNDNVDDDGDDDWNEEDDNY
jgi:hypothetical protein